MTNHSPQLSRILRMAEIESDREQSGQIETHHVLIAMCQEGANPGADLLQQNGITLEMLRTLTFKKPQ